MNIIKTIKSVLIALWVISVIGLLVSVPWLFFNMGPSETNYYYNVKAEQAYDVGRVAEDDVTEFEELEGDEREILYRAFKKTDHLLGSSEVRFGNGEERLSTFNGWRTVEVNGIVMVVAVDEDKEKEPSLDTAHAKATNGLALVSMLYAALGSLGMMFTPPRV